jgi:branched-chain amino acid transport system ATP-binding protein
MSLPEGESLGIVGPNGAGKTSLFGIISGDLRPDAGDVRLAGRSLSKLDSAERCRLGIGRTYQVPRPFEQMSVFENALVAAQQGAGTRRRQAYDLAAGVLDETGLAGVANVPAGSLGLLQRKRLEFARALATQPRLLLLDEVAGGLTDPEVHELVEIVRAARAAHGIGVIWIEHVVRALLESVDRLICLASGQIIGDGTPLEVLSMPSVKEVFLGVTGTDEGDAALGAAVLGLPSVGMGPGR